MWSDARGIVWFAKMKTLQVDTWNLESEDRMKLKFRLL